jgi:hypothetical protein
MYDRRARYTVTDIARIAGANTRSVQHWAASGILIAKPETNWAGTGNRRLFTADEAILACVLQPLVERQTPVGEMRRIAVLIRNELLMRGFVRRGLLNKMILGSTQAWFVAFAEQDDPAAMIVQKGGGALFDEIFLQMKEKQVAIVIDLTAALRGFREEKNEEE